MPAVREFPTLVHPFHEVPPLMSTIPACALAQLASAESAAADR
jgi:hypothetical protein